MTDAQSILLASLGPSWVPEFVVKTGRRGEGYPHCYKIDLANPECKIAIEIDGESHRGKSRQLSDARKTEFLESIGWRVVRYSNLDAMRRADEIAAELGGCIVDTEVISIEEYEIDQPYVYDITVERTHCYYAHGILVHNCQDMTMAQLAMAVGACARGGRVCVIGDDRQNLYRFRGTEHDGIDRLKAELEAAELPLTVTRRCPRLVVALASEIVPDFVAAPDAPEGEIDETDADRMLAAVRVGDFVLSRKNAPLVRVCMRLLKRNVRAAIRGNDIGKGILALVEKLDADTVEELRAKLAAWSAKECERARKRLDEEAAAERVAAVIDQQLVLLALLEDCEDVKDLGRRCDELFAREDDARPVVMCSSVHRAKGLEADTVYLLRDSFRFDGSIDELNILYVAETRTKRRLVWVDGAPS